MKYLAKKCNLQHQQRWSISSSHPTRRYVKLLEIALIYPAVFLSSSVDDHCAAINQLVALISDDKTGFSSHFLWSCVNLKKSRCLRMLSLDDEAQLRCEFKFTRRTFENHRTNDRWMISSNKRNQNSPRHSAAQLMAFNFHFRFLGRVWDFWPFSVWLLMRSLNVDVLQIIQHNIVALRLILNSQ